MTDKAEPAVAIESHILDLPPSCIEFCPAHPDYFLVGTYYLEKDEDRANGDLSRPQNRNGSIVVFRVEDRKIHCLETVSQSSALLDLHFQQTGGRQDIFAVASSTGTLSIFRLAPTTKDSRTGSSHLERLSVVRIPDNGEDVLFLSCVWHPTVPDLIAVTTSRGAVYTVGLQETQTAGSLPTTPVILHELEAWTVAFSPVLQDVTPQADGGWARLHEHGSNQLKGSAGTVYSGGDDSMLRYTTCALWTPGASNTPSLASEAVFDAIALRGHEAGVTAILPLALQAADGGRIVVTGSYDDHIRVFSVRDPLDTYGMQQARCLAEENLGGGVWRLKTISQTETDGGRAWDLRVLASCMHAGVRVVRIEGGHGQDVVISVTDRFEDHKSMNYGSDLQPGSALCVSTSFYDKLMCLWEIKDQVMEV